MLLVLMWRKGPSLAACAVARDAPLRQIAPSAGLLQEGNSNEVTDFPLSVWSAWSIYVVQRRLPHPASGFAPQIRVRARPRPSVWSSSRKEISASSAPSLTGNHVFSPNILVCPGKRKPAMRTSDAICRGRLPPGLRPRCADRFRNFAARRAVHRAFASPPVAH